MVDFIKYPVISEKTYLNMFKHRQYTFDVDVRLTKPQIQNLFENLFNVNVIELFANLLRNGMKAQVSIQV